MGLLDLPSPVFAFVDRWLFFLPDLVAIAFWALLSALGSMWLYHRFSKQEELAELKPRIKQVQRELARYDGPMNGLWPLIRRSTSLSGKQMGMTLWPALVASLPVLFVLAFLSNEYGHQFPQPGESVTVTPVGADTPASWQWRGSAPAEWSEDEGHWTVGWPVGRMSLTTGDDETLLALPTNQPVTVIHKRQWWNWLIANPAGYLDDDAPAEAVEIGIPRQRFLPFGPAWLGYWEIPYLVLLVAFSLTIKVRFGIH